VRMNAWRVTSGNGRAILSADAKPLKRSLKRLYGSSVNQCPGLLAHYKPFYGGSLRPSPLLAAGLGRTANY
jgi:hypothetical protein